MIDRVFDRAFDLITINGTNLLGSIAYSMEHFLGKNAVLTHEVSVIFQF
jgi:hypothetical protein